MNTLIDLS